jgi:hypothetical protein
VHGPVPARVRNHRHRPRPPQRARARCPTVTVPGPPSRTWARCPAEDDSASSGGTASATAPGRRSVPGRCRPGIARRVGLEPSDCAARCGSTGYHSGLRTDRRTAGLLCHVMGRTPSARLHALGAVPGRQRDEETAAVGYHSGCPSGTPRTRSEAGARKGPDRRTESAGRRPDRAGPPHESSLSYGPRGTGRGGWAGQLHGPIQAS